MKERKILGRGLSSLISDPRIVERAQNQKNTASHAISGDINTKVNDNPEKDTGQKNGQGLDVKINQTTGDKSIQDALVNIKLSNIFANPNQPRRYFSDDNIAELASSIKQHGVLQPIIVKHLSDNKYEIIAGERRWRAASLAGLLEIPALVRDLSQENLLETAIIENIQREDLSVIDEAFAYRELINCHGYTQDKLAKNLSKSHSYISNTLRLLNLPEEVLNLIREGKISAGHARILIGVENPEEMAKSFIENKLSVRGAEEYARQFSQNKQQKSRVGDIKSRGAASFKTKKEKHADYSRNGNSQTAYYNPNGKLFNQSESDLRAIEKAISEEINMIVNIYDTNKGGELSVKFQTLEQLDWLLERISMPKTFAELQKK